MRTQQFVCRCHRANTSVERYCEIGDRSVPSSGLGDDSSDGRERIFDAMIEFGIQNFAGLFGSLALGDVDVHADQASCVTGLIVLDEATRLDPADRSAGTHNAELCMLLAAPFGKYLLTMLKILRQVV